MNLIKSYIVYNVSQTFPGFTVSVDGVTIQGDGSSGNPLSVIAGVFDPAGSAAAAQSAAASDATTKANAAQAAAQTYADGLVVGLWDDRGNFDASVNAYPSSGGSGTAGAIKKGDIWTVSVAGTLPTNQVVELGDTVRALVDTPGNTQANWAIAQNNIGYVPARVNNDPTVIVDGAAISLTTAEHTLSTAQATISVTDSCTDDYSGLRLTLNGITQVVLTFVTGTALCAFNGTASGNNTMTVTGVAGDRVEIHRKKLGTNYTYVALNVGQ